MKIKKPEYFSQHHKRLITYFATSQKESTGWEVCKETARNYSKAPFTFLPF